MGSGHDNNVGKLPIPLTLPDEFTPPSHVRSTGPRPLAR